MNHKKINWSISFGLVFLIFFLVYVNYYYFIRGTKKAHTQLLKYVAETLKVKNKQTDFLFFNEFNHQKTFYLTKVDENLVAYDQNFNEVASMQYPGVKDLLLKKYKIEQVSFGYVNNRFIYVVRDQAKEIWFNIDDLKEIFSINYKGE